VPKFLRQPNQPTKLAFSLKTKDLKKAMALAFRINLDFEEWIEQMSKGDFKKLTITHPSGMSVDFDLKKPEEKEAYEQYQKQMLSGVEGIGVFKSSPSVQAIQQSRQYRLEDVFETFKKATNKTYSEATRNAYYPRIKKFIDYCQAKGLVAIDEVRKPLAVDYRDHLMDKEADKEKDPSPLTVDNHTKSIKQFFDHAIQVQKYQFDNPFSNLHLVKKSQVANVADSYLPFSQEELFSIFNLDGYKKRFIKPDFFYSPIIALTMGLREEEVSQLHLTDIYQINGIWVIDINEDSPDKELKTPSAKRVLPISRHVLKTNFLEYVEYVKTAYGDQYLLYPYLIKSKNGYGKNLGYNFTKHKQALITKNEAQKCFHSLRKNIGNHMKDKGYDLALRKTILGHSMIDDITETTYSGNFGLEFLKQKIDDLDFGIDFSLYQFRINMKYLDDLYRQKNRKLVRGVVNASRQSLTILPKK
jgi:site-specific recombinase XerD